MRVAIITETFLPKVDGIVKVTCLLLDHLRARGIEALVIAPRYGENAHYNDVPICSLPSISLPLYPEARLGFATFSLYRQLADFKTRYCASLPSGHDRASRPWACSNGWACQR